jgi:hypothetical protein
VTDGWRALLELPERLARLKHACAATTENIGGFCSAQSLCATITATSSNGMARTTDTEDRKRGGALLAAEKRTFEMIAGGARLADILKNLCDTIDAQFALSR